VGTYFFGVGDTVLSIKDRSGALFFVMTGQIISPALTLILTCRHGRSLGWAAVGRTLTVADTFLVSRDTVPMERSVFMREQDNHMYRIHTYYGAKVVSDLPFQIVLAMSFAGIVYWMVGLNTTNPTRFIIFYLMCVSCPLGVLCV